MASASGHFLQGESPSRGTVKIPLTPLVTEMSSVVEIWEISGPQSGETRSQTGKCDGKCDRI